MYAEDSFFTLTGFGQFSVACLSTLLGAAILAVAWRLMAGRAWPIRLLVACGLFYAFIWLAPQVYYTLYIFLLDGLPWQNVIQSPPTPIDVFSLLTFSDRANLSFHAQALLGWTLVLMVWLRRRVSSPPGGEDRETQ